MSSKNQKENKEYYGFLECYNPCINNIKIGLVVNIFYMLPKQTEKKTAYYQLIYSVSSKQ